MSAYCPYESFYCDNPVCLMGLSRDNFEQEEERRKRMEELLIQRQKRIAERSTGGRGSPMTSQKSKLQTSAEETKKLKPVLRSSTIERLAAAKPSPNAPTTQPKKDSKVSGSPKTAVADSKKVNMNKITPSEKKAGDEFVNRVSSISDAKDIKGIKEIDASVPENGLPTGQGLQTSAEVDDLKDIKELHIASVITKGVKVVEQMDTSNQKGENPLQDHSSKLDFIKDDSDVIPKQTITSPEEGKFSVDHGKIGPELSTHLVPESLPNHLGSARIVDEKIAANKSTPISTDISIIQESTPALMKETILDPTQLIKKWDSAENSPKAIKGFRKLLMFSRKK